MNKYSSGDGPTKKGNQSLRFQLCPRKTVEKVRIWTRLGHQGPTMELRYDFQEHCHLILTRLGDSFCNLFATRTQQIKSKMLQEEIRETRCTSNKRHEHKRCGGFDQAL